MVSPKADCGLFAECPWRAIRSPQARDQASGRPQGSSKSKREPINDPGAMLLAQGYGKQNLSESARISAGLPTSRQAAPFTSTPAHFSSKVSVAA